MIYVWEQSFVSAFLFYLTVSFCKQYISQFLGSFFSPFFVRNKSEVDDLFKEYTRVTPHEEEEAEIIYDKRKINSGRPEGNFDTFYKELDQIVE